MQTAPVPAALKRRAQLIQALEPPAQSEKFSADRWKAKVPYADVGSLVEDFPGGRIARNDLFRLGQLAIGGEPTDRRRLLIATLMWGYGPLGGRSYINANRVLGVTGLDKQLADCAAALRDADARAAFLALDGLSGYRIGFFTKYLYFLARDSLWDSDVAKPLIFDSRVENTLNFLRRALNVQWDAPLTPRHSAVTRYLHYCETVQAWATQLSLEPGVEGAEKVEQFLFSTDDLWFDVYAEMRRLAQAVARDCADESAGPYAREAMAAMNPDLLESFG
jgi:hypothetical protein